MTVTATCPAGVHWCTERHQGSNGFAADDSVTELDFAAGGLAGADVIAEVVAHPDGSLERHVLLDLFLVDPYRAGDPKLTLDGDAAVALGWALIEAGLRVKGRSG